MQTDILPVAGTVEQVPGWRRIARVVVRELRLEPRIEEIEGGGADARRT